MSNFTITSPSIGVSSLLGVAFVVLKLTGYIDWYWWLVTLPFWAFIPLVVLFIMVTVIVSIISNNRYR